jgi:hypothetical protein
MVSIEPVEGRDAPFYNVILDGVKDDDPIPLDAGRRPGDCSSSLVVLGDAVDAGFEDLQGQKGALEPGRADGDAELL